MHIKIKKWLATLLTAALVATLLPIGLTAEASALGGGSTPAGATTLTAQTTDVTYPYSAIGNNWYTFTPGMTGTYTITLNITTFTVSPICSLYSYDYYKDNMINSKTVNDSGDNCSTSDVSATGISTNPGTTCYSASGTPCHVMNTSAGSINTLSFSVSLTGGTKYAMYLYNFNSNQTGTVTIASSVSDFAVSSNSTTSTTASFSWTALPTDASSFAIDQSTDQTSWTESALSSSIDENSTSATVTGLSEGTLYYFKLVTTGGFCNGETSVVNATTMTNASISPTSGTFDLYASSSNHAAVSVTLSPGSYTLSAVKNGSATLTEGTGYTVSGSTYTFPISYLSTFTAGTTKAVTFDMSGGTDPTLSIAITDNTTFTISVLNDGNGTGNADFASAAKGTIVTLSSKPDSGYHFNEWQVITPSALSIPSNTFTMPDKAVIVKAVFEADTATDCAVTFCNGSTVYAAKTVASGGSISSAGWPTDPTKSGYTFNGWYTGENGSGSKFTSGTAVTSNITVYAYWSENSSGSGSSGGSSGGSADSGTTIKIETADDVTTASVDVTGSTDSSGTATASVKQKQMQDAVDAAAKEAAAKGTKAAVAFSVDTDDSATGISVSIPQTAIETAADGSLGALKISSPKFTVTFDETALNAINESADGDVTITAVPNDSAALSDSDKAMIGDRPVYNLSITSGSTTISGFGGGKATVSIPYTLADGEDANKIVVYYISGSGELVAVPNCVYDATTGTVTFTTTHFSNYAVGYNNVSFTDVSGWYTDYVSYLAARGIIGGTGDGKFSPGADITRAQFVTILARMSGGGLSGYTSSSFSDVATTGWYFAAVQWAHDNGVAVGSDGKFNPNATITRQNIAVMLARYADKVASYTLPKTNGAVTFTDSTKISSHAADAVTSLQQAGIISGNSDGSFAPTASATRAEAAKMIAVLLQDMIGS